MSFSYILHVVKVSLLQLPRCQDIPNACYQLQGVTVSIFTTCCQGVKIQQGHLDRMQERHIVTLTTSWQHALCDSRHLGNLHKGYLGILETGSKQKYLDTYVAVVFITTVAITKKMFFLTLKYRLRIFMTPGPGLY